MRWVFFKLSFSILNHKEVFLLPPQKQQLYLDDFISCLLSHLWGPTERTSPACRHGLWGRFHLYSAGSGGLETLPVYEVKKVGSPVLHEPNETNNLFQLIRTHNADLLHGKVRPGLKPTTLRFELMPLAEIRLGWKNINDPSEMTGFSGSNYQKYICWELKINHSDSKQSQVSIGSLFCSSELQLIQQDRDRSRAADQWRAALSWSTALGGVGGWIIRKDQSNKCQTSKDQSTKYEMKPLDHIKATPTLVFPQALMFPS